jgi:nicotinamidase-related amidase
MIVSASQSWLLVVDIQERLLPAMHDGARVVERTKILLTTAQTLGAPVAFSEQYPKGLGRTVAELTSSSAKVFEKMTFSCWRDEAIKSYAIERFESGRPQIIVAGIEAHVCVMQTCIDMAMAGFAVFAVEDAMSSRKESSAAIALERMRANSVQVINTEMAVFELLGKAGTAEFKTLSALIK